MKALQILSAPYLLIVVFLLVLISGEHIGGFYLLYLLLALPHGGVHALLALGGIVCLLVVHKRIDPQRKGALRLAGMIAGVFLLFGSLFTFFYNDKRGYNDGTFEQAVPVATLVLLSVVALLFLALSSYQYLKAIRSRRSLHINGR